jgi:hypothetical protein
VVTNNVLSVIKILFVGMGIVGCVLFFMVTFQILIIKNEMDEKFETWDIDHRERITEQEKEIKDLTYQSQRNTIAIAFSGSSVICCFWNN